MNSPTAPAEHLLLLASDFTRHNDALTRTRPTGSNTATDLTHQAAFTQHLADSALHIVDILNAEPMYHSPAIRAVYARVRQFAHLTADATDLLLGAVALLDDTHAGIPVQDEGRLLTRLTYQQALDEAGSRVTLVRDLIVLGAQDALTTAKLFVTERRRRGMHRLPSRPHCPPLRAQCCAPSRRAR